MDPDLLAFIRSSIKSVWSLELLLLLRRRAPSALSTEELVRDLRATRLLINTCTQQLQTAGVVACEADGGCRYAPASPILDDLCARLGAAYAEKPLAVTDAIVSSPNDRLRSFADAFRLKPKDE